MAKGVSGEPLEEWEEANEEVTAPAPATEEELAAEEEDRDDEDDLEPLTPDEVLRALEFLAQIAETADGDDAFYRLNEAERTKMPAFLAAQLSGNTHFIKAVRTLDFLDGWGLVAWAVIRRGIHFYRKHYGKNRKEKEDVDQAQEGHEIQWRDL